MERENFMDTLYRQKYFVLFTKVVDCYEYSNSLFLKINNVHLCQAFY